ncbi:hypothetical protein [Bifidobacterium samirii]|uniref:Lipoprotein n=1 Tax=Bifidobacterium samirii TaxID=2306974 RepID=A0A430FNR6_9BIFI|nr:hypothetical protein [Bifidobacterium samirii]RSX54480.1 hypothetical protein D2E24_1601 [Bifidobacterium samirii]
MQVHSLRFASAKPIIAALAGVVILLPLTSCASTDAQAPADDVTVTDTERSNEATSNDTDPGHVLDRERVARLESMVRTPDDAIVAAGPTPSYETVAGRRQIATIRNEDDLTYGPGHYVLTTYCMGENSLTIDFSMGDGLQSGTMSCTPESSSRQLEFILVETERSMSVQITPDATAPAEIAYRLDLLS